MPTTLSVKSTDNAGVTYANPAVPTTICRFRSAQAAKTLSGVQTTNYSAEVIYNDVNPVTIGGITVQDALSVRLRVSGTLESKARLRVLLLSLAAQVGQWETENAMQGFRPSTAPVIL